MQETLNRDTLYSIYEGFWLGPQEIHSYCV